jgi:toxin ParE1/3/4
VSAARRRWSVRLAAAAEADFRDILRWTAEHFGHTQARFYANTLSAALEDLGTGPNRVGVRVRSDIANGLFTLHVARHGRKGRHFVLFRIGRDQQSDVIEVLRLLHDAMDLPSHVPPPDE